MGELCSTCGGPLVEGVCDDCGDLYVWPSDDADDPLVGRILDGRYRIHELLTVGGMARLYRGVQTSLDRPVAIKVLPPQLLAAGDEEMVAELVSRFFTEAKAMSRLNHPNVVSVYDFGRMPDTGWLYMVMELLAGVDLWQVIHSETLTLVEIGNIVTQTLEALAEAHSAGITHRDIKPENIIVERRRDGLHHVRVIDFGVAKLGAGGAVTRSGRIVGSPHYMSPEQARGEPVSDSADLYSVGVLLFELITGHVPFDGHSALDILTKLQSEPAPDPRTMTDRPIPDDVVELCRRALAKNPEERFPGAAEFALAVADALAPGSRSSLVPGLPSAPPAAASAASRARGSAPPLVATSALGVKSPSGEGTLYCRAAHLRRVAALLEPGASESYVCFAGEEGTGRSRLAAEAVAMARAVSEEAVLVRPPPFPKSEVGFSAVAALIAAVLGREVTDPRLRSGQGAPGPLIGGGLKIAFGAAQLDPSYSSAFISRAVRSALDWSLGELDARTEGRGAAIVIDDIHRADYSSQVLLADLIAAGPPAIQWVLLGRNPNAYLQLRSDATMALPKLPPEAAAELAAERGGRGLAARLSAASATEPLLVELASRIPLADGEAVTSLVGLLTRAFTALSMREKRAIAAISVLGEASSPHIARVAADDEFLEGVLPKLLEWGLVEVESAIIRCSHEVIARTARLQLTARTRAEIFDAAAELHRELGSPVECTAALAVRGNLDLAGFVDVEQAIVVRRQRGDLDGTIDFLQQAMKGARALGRHGDHDAAASARRTFGRQLVGALHEAERGAEAERVVEELVANAEMDGIDPDELERELGRLRAETG